MHRSTSLTFYLLVLFVEFQELLLFQVSDPSSETVWFKTQFCLCMINIFVWSNYSIESQWLFINLPGYKESVFCLRCFQQVVNIKATDAVAKFNVGSPPKPHFVFHFPLGSFLSFLIFLRQNFASFANSVLSTYNCKIQSCDTFNLDNLDNFHCIYAIH